jgi:mRNA interferase MazF
MVKYIPDRGDLIWLEFEPQKGKEIQKTRPAFVVSVKEYNQKARLALCMPITSHVKGYPFEVYIANEHIKGAILCDQIRSLDWAARNAKYICKANPQTYDEIIGKFSTLIT